MMNSKSIIASLLVVAASGVRMNGSKPGYHIIGDESSVSSSVPAGHMIDSDRIDNQSSTSIPGQMYETNIAYNSGSIGQSSTLSQGNMLQSEILCEGLIESNVSMSESSHGNDGCQHLFKDIEDLKLELHKEREARENALLRLQEAHQREQESYQREAEELAVLADMLEVAPERLRHDTASYITGRMEQLTVLYKLTERRNEDLVKKNEDLVKKNEDLAKKTHQLRAAFIKNNTDMVAFMSSLVKRIQKLSTLSKVQKSAMRRELNKRLTTQHLKPTQKTPSILSLQRMRSRQRR